MGTDTGTKIEIDLGMKNRWSEQRLRIDPCGMAGRFPLREDLPALAD